MISDRNPSIFKSFTTPSANYDLFTQVDIRESIEDLISTLSEGVEADIFLKFNSDNVTLTINDRQYPEALINKCYWSGMSGIKSIKVKESGVSGNIVITVR